MLGRAAMNRVSDDAGSGSSGAAAEPRSIEQPSTGSDSASASLEDSTAEGFAGGAADSPSSSQTTLTLPLADEEALKALREREKGQHGCTHYRRRCRMVAPCCGEVFWCRHCHNEAKCTNEPDVKRRHELDRTAVRELLCALCDTRQPVGPHCAACGVAFGAYTCAKCCFFDDELSKQQFHCDPCGICRVGGAANFFHCSTCGSCYAVTLRNNHKCVENSMRQNCPICFEYLFDSVRPTAVLRCGHTLHSACLQEMERNRQLACPMCMKSYADMDALWRRYDEEIAATPMPDEYANWVVEILCNDCSQRSRVRFHIMGHKCSAPSCGSYNTRRIALQRAAPHGAGTGAALADEAQLLAALGEDDLLEGEGDLLGPDPAQG